MLSKNCVFFYLIYRVTTTVFQMIKKATVLHQRTNEKVEIPQLTETEKLASQSKTISSESILTHVQQLNNTHWDILLKKFQLLYFIIQNLSFHMFNELAMFEKRLSHSKPRKLVSFQQDFWRNDAIFFTLYYVTMLQSLCCMMDYTLLKHAELGCHILKSYHYNNQKTQTLLDNTWHCKIH